MIRSLALVAAAVLVSVTFGGCGRGSNEATPSSGTTTSAPASTATTISTTTTPTAATTTPTTALTTTTEPPTTTAPPSGPAQVIRHGDPSRPAISLTFDAGSDAGYTGQILDTLATNGIRASFGLTGKWVEANPELARRIAAEGHQILNHTYDHRSFTGRSSGDPPLSAAERADELARADTAIRDATGLSTPPWFRPPYGDYDASVLGDAADNGYAYAVMWTIDSLGWKGASAQEIVARCLENAEPGAIYLFHVGSASQDGAALQTIIDDLRARGYSFATVAGLIGRARRLGPVAGIGTMGSRFAGPIAFLRLWAGEARSRSRLRARREPTTG